MKKLITTFLILFLGLSAFSQVSFDKAYFIKNNGERVECLIKNKGWKNNPKDFVYRLSKDSESKTITIDSVKEFKVAENKYIRQSVKIDTSGTILETYSYKKKPLYKEAVVFLKVLVEGKANLYFYSQNSLPKYFYNVDTSAIKQLIYKKYYYQYNNVDNYPETDMYNNNPLVLKVNDRYRFQLLSDLKSENITRQNIYNTDYKVKALMKIFIKYNEADKEKYTVYKQKEVHTNIVIKPSMSYSFLEIYNFLNSNYTSYYFNNLVHFGLGVEFEMVLPFNNNKWSTFFEPNFQYFNSFKDVTYPVNSYFRKTVEVDYKAVFLPVGIKYGMYLNSDNKLFINAGVNGHISFDSKIIFDGRRATDANGFSVNYLGFLGIGYKYKNKYTADIKYYRINMLDKYMFWNAKYRPLTLSLGYTIF